VKETLMKKSLLALAVLAAAGSASAQSSVTLFGIVDATLTWGRGNGAGSADRFQLTNSGYNSSRLGFRGTEDLGGGMSASFWLEMGFNNDDGTGLNTNINNQPNGQATAPAGTQGLTFGRRSTVSLASGWGELRLGRDYVPQFWNRTLFDPFGTNGVGTNLIHNLSITGVTAVRASNSIGYFLPANLGGFYGQIQYYAGENRSDAGATHRDGNGAGARLGFASGPFNVAAATGITHYAAGDVRQSNIGGSWDFGMARLLAQYERERNNGDKASGWLVGSLIPVGPGEVRVSYARFKSDPAGAGLEPRSSKIALGYVHNLSKRTALYATYAHVKNSNGAKFALGGAVTAANNGSNGVDLGMRHSF
jgi:predicted porin